MIMIDDRLKEGKEYLEKISPEICAFLNRIATGNNGACVIGFIFSGQPRAFMKFGNVGNQGDDFVRITTVLATLAGEAALGHYPGTPFLEILGSRDFKELNQEDPDKLSEDLARLVMSGMEGPEFQMQCMDLANRFFAAKYPPPPEEPPSPMEPPLDQAPEAPNVG
jgi:hypothetical protein